MFTGNSYEILGKSIDSKNALGIFDFETNITDKRITSDIIFTSDWLKNKLVGFINNMSSLTGIQSPAFNVQWGLKDKTEGLVYKNLIGTHVIGPILIRNPELLQLIITRICKQKDEKFEYKNIEYKDEFEGYELVLNELETRSQAE